MRPRKLLLIFWIILIIVQIKLIFAVDYSAYQLYDSFTGTNGTAIFQIEYGLTNWTDELGGTATYDANQSKCMGDNVGEYAAFYSVGVNEVITCFAKCKTNIDYGCAFKISNSTGQNNHILPIQYAVGYYRYYNGSVWTNLYNTTNSDIFHDIYLTFNRSSEKCSYRVEQSDNTSSFAYHEEVDCYENGVPYYVNFRHENANGFSIFDDISCWIGTYLDKPTEITNSSWNVTSGNLATGIDSTAWNNGSRINITSNLLSFTVETNVATNMSCVLDHEWDYNTAVANNSNYKAATTETTSHSYTLYDNISVGNHYVYCSFITADGNIANSGKLLLTRNPANISISCNSFILNTNYTTFQNGNISYKRFEPEGQSSSTGICSITNNEDYNISFRLSYNISSKPKHSMIIESFIDVDDWVIYKNQSVNSTYNWSLQCMSIHSKNITTYVGRLDYNFKNDVVRWAENTTVNATNYINYSVSFDCPLTNYVYKKFDNTSIYDLSAFDSLKATFKGVENSTDNFTLFVDNNTCFSVIINNTDWVSKNCSYVPSDNITLQISSGDNSSFRSIYIDNIIAFNSSTPDPENYLNMWANDEYNDDTAIQLSEQFKDIVLIPFNSTKYFWLWIDIYPAYTGSSIILDYELI